MTRKNICSNIAASGTPADGAGLGSASPYPPVCQPTHRWPGQRTVHQTVLAPAPASAPGSRRRATCRIMRSSPEKRSWLKGLAQVSTVGSWLSRTGTTTCFPVDPADAPPAHSLQKTKSPPFSSYPHPSSRACRGISRCAATHRLLSIERSSRPNPLSPAAGTSPSDSRGHFTCRRRCCQ